MAYSIYAYISSEGYSYALANRTKFPSLAEFSPIKDSDFGEFAPIKDDDDFGDCAFGWIKPRSCVDELCFLAKLAILHRQSSGFVLAILADSSVTERTIANKIRAYGFDELLQLVRDEG